jgi:hypothetical protein
MSSDELGVWVDRSKYIPIIGVVVAIIIVLYAVVI